MLGHGACSLDEEKMPPPADEKSNATSQVMPTSRASADWDAQVSHAFLEGCVHEGVRAKLTMLAIASAGNPQTEKKLRQAVEDAERRAASAWLSIETCLEQYG